MKIRFSVILLLLLSSMAGARDFFAPEYIRALSGGAGEQFLLLGEEENIVFSPAGTALCTAYLAAGASEEDAKGCGAAWGITADLLTENSVKAQAYLRRENLRKKDIFFSSDLWTGVVPAKDYRDKLRVFDTEPKDITFESGAGERLAAYYGKQFGTEMKINVPEGIEDYLLLLTSCASVTPRWSCTLPESENTVDFFRPYGSRGRALIYFPCAGSFLYKETADSFFVSLPFADGLMRLDIFCPDTKKGLREAAEQLSRGTDPGDGAKERRLIVYLPRTDIEGCCMPFDTLCGRGLKDLGYSHITGRLPVPVGNILSFGQLRLKPGETSAVPNIEEELRITRPFMFVIRDSRYSLPVLAGLCLVCK